MPIHLATQLLLRVNHSANEKYFFLFQREFVAESQPFSSSNCQTTTSYLLPGTRKWRPRNGNSLNKRTFDFGPKRLILHNQTYIKVAFVRIEMGMKNDCNLIQDSLHVLKFRNFFNFCSSSSFVEQFNKFRKVDWWWWQLTIFFNFWFVNLLLLQYALPSALGFYI